MSQPSRPQERVIECSRKVCRRNNKYSVVRHKAIEKRQELPNEPVGCLVILFTPLRVQAIDLIKEKNRRAVSLCMLEDLAESTLRLSNKLVYDHGPADVVERSIKLRGKASSKKRFPRAGGPAEEYALDGINSHCPQWVVGRKSHGSEIEGTADKQYAAAKILQRRDVVFLTDNKGIRVEIVVAEKAEVVNGFVCNYGHWLAIWPESNRLSLDEGTVGSLSEVKSGAS